MKSRVTLIFVVALSAVLAPAAAHSRFAAGSRGSASPLPLTARVIQKGELPGFGPFGGGGTTSRFTSAGKWVSGNTALTPAQASAQIARLQREGFKAVLSEQLGSLKPDRGGLSWVMQLGAAARARAEVVALIHDWQSTSHPPESTYTAFPVSTIPGAHGYLAGGSRGNSTGANVVFADGPFVYLIGDGWSKTTTRPPPRSQLIAAATKLYKRVHGRPAP